MQVSSSGRGPLGHLGADARHGWRAWSCSMRDQRNSKYYSPDKALFGHDYRVFGEFGKDASDTPEKTQAWVALIGTASRLPSQMK